MSSPLVSIIMAARNEEKYISECIDSIIHQNFENWELVVVNDHSSDKTGELLGNYANLDSRIHIYPGVEGTLIPSLREAYAMSTGELITRLDADDIMPPQKLSTLVNTWQKYGKGFLVSGQVRHFNEHREIGNGFKRYDQWLNNVQKGNSHLEEIYKECVTPSNAWMAHREDFDKAEAFNSDLYPEDYDLCFRFYRSGIKIVGIDKLLHLWRDRPERITRTQKHYDDNRYYPMKVKYFIDIDYDPSRPLVVWGAGRNGKDFVKELQKNRLSPRWLCNNEKRIGKSIYNTQIEHYSSLERIQNPQLLIAVASPAYQLKIKNYLRRLKFEPIKQYWFVQ